MILQGSTKRNIVLKYKILLGQFLNIIFSYCTIERLVI
nr:MAG TPA_asm: hypothetical protein [Caudoviricetes sp.]